MKWNRIEPTEHVERKRLRIASRRIHADLVHGMCTGSNAAKPKLPENFEQRTTAKLKDAVTAVHEKRPVNCSLEELYQVRHARHFVSDWTHGSI